MNTQSIFSALRRHALRLRDGAGRWVGHDLLAGGARLSIAAVFWMSGRTKVEGWLSVTDSAVALFEDEYRLPLLSPDLAAHWAAYAEHLFPLLLVLGLATRLSALALLLMTAVIQIFVYPTAWPTHLSWATLLLYLLGRGGGRLSLDHVIGFGRQP
ncbi:DoxX family protein [Paucibacter sp. AS339]|uniref:DoxX family protein n=1 Tax=Paucibacter hankyongi TaxID=3133434 RepID=UPI0030B0B37E